MARVVVVRSPMEIIIGGAKTMKFIGNTSNVLSTQTIVSDASIE